MKRDVKIPRHVRSFGIGLQKAFKPLPALLICALLLCGCARPQEATPSTEADGSIQIGSVLRIPSWPDALTLYDSKDALAAEGLYYASWVCGKSRPYTNGSGVETDLYQAQATLLGAERKDPQSASNEIESWKSASADNYAISDTRTETINGQEYEFLTYTMKNPDSPWSGGVSAFGVHSSLAVCAEVTYQDSFKEDPRQLLRDLLGCFSYTSEKE